MQNQNLSIFIPDSFLSETKDVKLKTNKVGLIGRALALYRVNQVIIYKDLAQESSDNDGDFIAEILAFMNTPQYLRKEAFAIKPELKYVGILPPLRAPHHPVNTDLDVGDYRQGFTVKRNKKGTFVDIGLDKLAFCKDQLTVKKIFSFKIVKVAKEIIVTPEEPEDTYWGYETISTHKSLKNSLKLVKPDFVVLTTRYANTINTIFDEMAEKVEKANNIAILFGGPYSSIEENIESSNWDLVKINTIPNQGCETVRTEEAVSATLAIFNLLMD